MRVPKRRLLVLMLPGLLAGMVMPRAAAQSTNAAYGLFKGQGYLQYTDTMTLADPARAAYWECWVRPVQSGVASVTMVRKPTLTTVALAADAEGERLLTPFPQLSLCDATFPAGTYVLSNQLAGSTRSVSLSLPSAGYPPVPLLAPLAAVMAPMAGEALDVNWQPFAGAGPNDLIQVTLEDISGRILWHTPWAGQAGALAATTTHCTIPGQYLTANADNLFNYLRLSFLKVTSTGDGGYPGSQATAGLVSTASAIVNVQAAPEGGDVADYRLLGGRVWQQPTNAPPVPSTGANAFLFEASATGIDSGRLTGTVLQTPTDQLITLAPNGDDRTLSCRKAFASETEWQQATALGTYNWTFDGVVEGQQQASLAFGAAAWPAAPQILGVAQLQGGAFADDFLLNWNPIPGATTNDLIEVAIVDPRGNIVWRHPDPTAGDAPLAGTEIGVTVPSGNVVGGRNYEGRVRFLKVQVRDTLSLVGATGLAARFAETRFPLATLSARPIEVLTTRLAPGEVGGDYAQQLACDGGRKPFAWTLTQGALPRGVQLDSSNGALAGIPAQSGTFNLTFRVSDVSGQTASQALSLVVTGSVPPLALATAHLPPVIPGIAYFAELAVGGGVPPYRWSLVSGKLPAGVELQGCCGQITGKPTETGLFTIQLQLEDGAGQIQSSQLTLDVPASALEPPLQITRFTRQADGHVVLEVNSQTDDPLTIEASDDLVHWSPRLATTLPASKLLEFTDPGAARGFYRVRFGHPGPVPDPIAVRSLLNTNTDASMSREVTSDGVTLSLTNALGVVFTLDLPANSVLVPTTVTMTLVEDVVGQPFTNGFIGGVELKPEGLHLFMPGTLTISFPGGAPADFTAFAYRGRGSDFHLHPALARSGQVVLPIQHFSGYGGAHGTKQQANQTSTRPPCLPMYQGEQAVAAILRDSYPDMPPSGALWPPMTAWYGQSVLPNLKAAETNDALLDAAAAEFLRWEYLKQLLGLGEEWDQKGLNSLARGLANAINKANARCVSDSNLGEIPNMTRLAKSAQLLGLESYYPEVFNTEALLDRISRCARFELILESIIEVDGGKFFEQVRSQPAHIQWSPQTLKYTIGDTVGMNVVFWHLESDGNRIKPEIGTGKLHIGYMDISHGESDSGEEPPDPANPCQKPPPDDTPPNIFCFFTVSDPITGMWVQDAEGSWHLQPLTGDMGGRWQPLFKIAHVQELTQFPDFSGSGDVVEGYGIKDRWDYFGNRLFARATYEGSVNYSGGKANETTTLELRHVPLPLRNSN
ncbi:MAG: Ig domain-containing protein [Akkermansiaceae bacterium]|nr:Ig domain-containing protein [Akkermansiaceae bacterium]MCF7731917.1 Ig domain-containing protein [Akkermansiaceae bacterium]